MNVKIILTETIEDFISFLELYFYESLTMGIMFGLVYSISLLYIFLFNQDGYKVNPIRILKKFMLVILLGFYCCQVICITILSREPEMVYIVNLIPFSTLGMDVWHMTLWIENILMMIPLAVILYILALPFRKLIWSVLVGFLASLSIECTQLITQMGKFEVDDIMNNVFGMLIGFLLCKGLDELSSVFGFQR